MKTYINLLKEKKLVVTPQRLELVNILSSHEHLNVDEIYKLLSITFQSVSLATVYKNIHTMIEKDFLMEVQIPHKKNVYELKKNAHSHIICSKCSEILDINLNTEKLIAEAEKKSNFKLNSNSLVFSGICSRCQIA